MSVNNNKVNLKPAGRAWLFRDNVDTDQISPGKVLSLPLEEQMKHALVSQRPEFPGQVRPGDLIVAGKNFGCGSSREHAPEVLKAMGVGAILAGSFGRIFYRNSIAIGLPVLIVQDAAAAITDGDRVEVEIEKANVRNLTKNTFIKGRPLEGHILDILKAGGIINKLRADIRRGSK